MTLKELNKKVRDSPHYEWAKDLAVTFKFDHLDFTIEKKGFQDIYWFIQKESGKWQKDTDALQEALGKSKTYWSQLLDYSIEVLREIETEEGNYLENYWDRLERNIHSTSSSKYLLYDNETTKFLLELSKQASGLYTGAEQILLFPENSLRLHQGSNLEGAMLAYEFKHANDSGIPSRRVIEKENLENIRKSVEEFNTQTNQETNEFHDALKKKAKSHSEGMDDLIEGKKGAFDDWFTKTKTQEEEFNSSSKKRIATLESTYTDKLMLEKPAEYWDKRAAELKGEGEKWLWWLIGSSVFGILILFAILFIITDSSLESLFENPGKAIRWSIVFISLLSFIAYGIRTFAKLMFSTYHLVRDAEERKQLVFVYLALKEEKEITSEERQLILQSIFSRSDSGLLRNDSSPTMPGAGGLIEKIIGKG